MNPITLTPSEEIQIAELLIQLLDGDIPEDAEDQLPKCGEMKKYLGTLIRTCGTDGPEAVKWFVDGSSIYPDILKRYRGNLITLPEATGSSDGDSAGGTSIESRLPGHKESPSFVPEDDTVAASGDGAATEGHRVELSEGSCPAPVQSEEEVSVPESQVTAQTGDDSGGASAGRNDVGDWLDPAPLSELSKPMAFDPAMLPQNLWRWVEDISVRMQVPKDFPAAGCITILGSAIGRNIGIRPKQHGPWTVTPNLYGLLVGPPGIMKSPALSEVARPLWKLEKRAAEKYAEKMAAYEAHQRWVKAREREINAELKGAEKLAEAQAVCKKYDMAKPVCQRFIINDTTIEKLGEILQENSKGVLMMRDEIAAWYHSLKKPGNEGARQFYLEAWDGTGSFIFDRIGRGTVRVPHVCLSMIGTIQPGVVNSLLASGLEGGELDDGLLQRFQIFVWPELTPEFVNVDRPPDADAAAAAYETIFKLAKLIPGEVGAEPDDDPERGIPYLRFDSEAQGLFNDWRVALENRIRSGQESAAFTSHLAKYRSLLPSIALIYHLASGNKGPVTAEAVQAAKQWIRYLESHARRLYAVAGKPSAASTLAEHLKKGDLESGFTCRDVYRKGWTGLNQKEIAENAIGTLVDKHWLRAEQDQGEGRPTVRYLINPKVLP